MTRGKVVLVPFPFDDLSTAKARPAVCLTDSLGPYRHLVLAFVTSRPPEDALASDIVLDPASPHFGTTGLRVLSTVRLHRLVTVASHVIARELGTLAPADQKRVDDALRQLLHL